MTQIKKEYQPIIFSDLQIGASNKPNDFIEEKQFILTKLRFPIIKTTSNISSQQRLFKALSLSKCSSEGLAIPKNAKSVVFPNILQRTKEDIKKLRSHQLSMIYCELSSIQPIIDQDTFKNIKQEKSKQTQKMHSQQPSCINFKPIRTDLSTLYQDSNLDTYSNDSLLKFRKLSPNFNGEKWQKNNQVNRINIAHEIQKEIHHLERFKTYWKSDMINQYLQLKIIQKGLNFKKGLRQIHLLINLPHQTIVLKSSQTEVKHSPTTTELNAFIYFIPVYEKINSTSELFENFNDWSKYFLDLLHYKQFINTVKYYFLDGREVVSLNQIASYEKLIFCNLNSKFDFWDQIGANLSLPGSFQFDKYVKLSTKLMDLRLKDDILRFFCKREHFLPYFSLTQEVSDDERIKPIITQIEQIEQEDEEQLKEDIFDQSIFYMSKQQQKSYLKTLQSFIQQNKTKYNTILNNQEEGMRQRKQNIKVIRRKSIETKLKIQKQLLQPDEQAHIERKILFSDEQTIEEIKEDATDQIDHFNNAVYKKQKKKIEFSSDPFSSFSSKDNQRFKEIIKLVNIEQIVLDKKVSRQDVLHYLSLFKALMDSDDKDQFTLKEIDFPSLYISKDQLRRSLPYIILYNNKLNTAKLNEIYDRKYNYVEFLEFLDIFTTEYVVSDKELKQLDQENQQHEQK